MTGREVQIFNAVHRNPAPWGLFMATLQKHYDLEAEEVSLPEWLNRLDRLVSSHSADSSKLRVLKSYDFLRSLAEGREENMGCRSENAARVLGDVTPITEDLLAAWIRTWNLKLGETRVTI